MPTGFQDSQGEAQRFPEVSFCAPWGAIHVYHLPLNP